MQDRNGDWRVKGVTEISDLNETIGSHFPTDEFDTLAGVMMDCFGHVPKRGESIACYGYRCLILRADSRRVHSILLEKITDHHEA